MATTNEELPALDPDTARIVRLHLERVAARIERVAANRVYMTAYKKAATMFREAKPD